MSEPLEHATSGGVRERRERGIETAALILNHTVQYAPTRRRMQATSRSRGASCSRPGGAPMGDKTLKRPPKPRSAGSCGSWRIARSAPGGQRIPWGIGAVGCAEMRSLPPWAERPAGGWPMAGRRVAGAGASLRPRSRRSDRSPAGQSTGQGPWTAPPGGFGVGAAGVPGRPRRSAGRIDHPVIDRPSRAPGSGPARPACGLLGDRSITPPDHGHHAAAILELADGTRRRPGRPCPSRRSRGRPFRGGCDRPARPACVTS